MVQAMSACGLEITMLKLGGWSDSQITMLKLRGWSDSQITMLKLRGWSDSQITMLKLGGWRVLTNNYVKTERLEWAHK